MRGEAPLWRRYVRLFGPNLSADIDDEVRHHVELLIELYIARGLSPGEARAAAERKFGDVLTVKSDCEKIAQRRRRAMARAEMWDRLLQDIRFAVRTFARTPGFTAAALLTLGLGLGANTAVFSVVNAVLLRPLPYGEPEQVTAIWTRSTPESGSTIDFMGLSVPEFKDYRAAARSLSAVSAYQFRRSNFTGGDGSPDRIANVAATAAFFDVVGVRPVLGRGFRAGEDASGAQCVVVLSDGMWRTRYAARSDVLNQTMRLDGEVCTIIGVMPAGFFFPTTEVALWRPFAIDADAELSLDRGSHWFAAFGRLAPGASLTAAEAEVNSLMAAWRAEDDHHLGHFILLQPFRESLVGDDRTVLLVVLGGVGLVLLIICANLANLLLVRADSRRREVAVRVALGAGRARLIRQMMTESLLLAITGGVIALLTGPALVKLLTSLDPDAVPTVGGPTTLDARVLGFTIAVSLFTGVLFGLFPAFQVSALRLQETLKSEGRALTAGPRSLALRRGLVALEIATCLAVVSAAGLLVQSYQRMQAVDVGFTATDLLSLDVTLPAAEYAEPARVQRFYSDLRARVAALPGVQSTGLMSVLPFRTSPPSDGFRPEGRPDPQAGEFQIEGGYILTTPGAFDALGVPLVRGRHFDERDVSGAPLVAIIDETAAKMYWPGQDPIGHRIRYYGSDSLQWLTIVGIVGPVNYLSPRLDLRANVYAPHAQMPRQFYNGRAMMLLVRSHAGREGLITAIRGAVKAVDPTVPVTRISAMDDVVARALGRPRLAAGLMALFGIAALIVGALGVYGLLSYIVLSRTNEIGIRMALGADAGRVRREILLQGLTIATVGIAVGTGVALMSGKLLGTMLFGVEATDTATFTTGISVLVFVTALASWLPARRATRVDPLTALRS
ncbi:MAG: ABC transporter permease [Gemmatimonadota bacterium]